MGTLAPTIGVARVPTPDAQENEGCEGTKGSVSWSLVAWNAGRNLESDCTLARIKALMDSNDVVGVNESGHGHDQLMLHGRKVIHAPRRDSKGKCMSSGGAFLAIKEDFARNFVIDNHDAFVQFCPPQEVAAVMLRSECVGLDGPAVALVCPYVPPPGRRLSSEEVRTQSTNFTSEERLLRLFWAARHYHGERPGQTGCPATASGARARRFQICHFYHF